VVSAISPRPGAHGGPASPLVAAAQALIAGTKQGGASELAVVGGAGTLEAAPGAQLMESPQFPDTSKPEAQEHRDALAVYRASAGDLNWTVIGPAADFQPGERTGRHRTSGDELPVDEQGRSHISFEDYADALVDELERPGGGKPVGSSPGTRFAGGRMTVCLLRGTR
jgi:uncharacterized protein